MEVKAEAVTLDGVQNVVAINLSKAASLMSSKSYA
jgi:hypothetical protein